MLPIHRCLYAGKTQEFSTEINKNNELLNVKDSDGNNLLHLAGFCGNVELVKYLLQENISIFEQDNDKSTPLLTIVFMAILPKNKELSNIFQEIITLILEHEQKLRKTFPNKNDVALLINTPNCYNITPLKLVTVRRKNEFYTKLFEKYQMFDQADSLEDSLSTSSNGSDDESFLSTTPPKASDSINQINALLNQSKATHQRTPTMQAATSNLQDATDSSPSETTATKQSPSGVGNFFSKIKSFFPADEIVPPVSEKAPLLKAKNH